jgi:vancomycin resistance protein VanJ
MSHKTPMQLASRAVFWLVLGGATAYCLAIVGLAILWATAPEARWWIAVTNIFAALLFAPLLVLLPAALLLPSWWLRGVVAMPLAIFLASFGALLVPPAPAPAEGTPLRVVTFNQLHSNRSTEEIVAAIRAQDADVVALQELSWNVADAAEEQLSDLYPYQQLLQREWPSRLGLLSRYPFEVGPVDGEVKRQLVTLDVTGSPVTLINVHLPSPEYETTVLPFRRLALPSGYEPFWREREARHLLATIDEIEGPLILLGDHNTSDREPLYQEFAARLTDVYRETSWGFGHTYPTNRGYFGFRLPFPLIRIDYVWVRDGVAPVASEVLCETAGSDHCMLVADLRLTIDD